MSLSDFNHFRKQCIASLHPLCLAFNEREASEIVGHAIMYRDLPKSVNTYSPQALRQYVQSMRPYIHATLSKEKRLGDDDLGLFRETEAYLGLYVRRHTAGEWWISPQSPVDLAIRFAYNTKGDLLDEHRQWMLYLDILAQMVWSDVETGQSTDIVAYIHRYSVRRRRGQD